MQITRSLDDLILRVWCSYNDHKKSSLLSTQQVTWPKKNFKESEFPKIEKVFKWHINIHVSSIFTCRRWRLAFLVFRKILLYCLKVSEIWKKIGVMSVEETSKNNPCLEVIKANAKKCWTQWFMPLKLTCCWNFKISWIGWWFKARPDENLSGKKILWRFLQIF